MSDNRPDCSPEIGAYLQRIGYFGPLDGSAEVLAELQERHLHTVPYENLDILQGTPISLKIPDLYNKIVLHRRGGYCFELNALFGWLLHELGYGPITDYVARFWRDATTDIPKRRHQVLKVTVGNETYLCDVGVGGIVPRRPLLLVEGLEQPQGEECYRLEQSEYGWMLCERKRNQWSWLYSFTEERQLQDDFVMTSFWCEHASDSIFNKHPIVALRTKEGRKTLDGSEFRTFSNAGVHCYVPESTEAYRDALKQYFDLELDDLQGIFKNG
ncbi:acetyltransferase [Paenibacillaceae bacterium]|nr:acetyltransferase [Paenibacillaceae bacterium]